MPIFIRFQKPSDPQNAVRGSSEDTGHPHWVDVDSVSTAVVRSTSASRGVAKPDKAEPPPEISATTADGAAFPSLVQGCAMGTRYGTVTVEMSRQGLVYLRLELADVYVTSCHTSGSPSVRSPMVQFALAARAIKYTYFEAPKDYSPLGWTPSQPPPAPKTKP